MKPLASWERQVFAAAAAALLGVPEFGDGPLASVDRILRSLPAPRRRMLRAFLALLEFGGPGLRLRRARFTSLPREDAIDLLAGWAEARPPALRRGVNGLRALAGLAYYGDDASWAAIGYDGPWLGRIDVAVLPAPWPPLPAPVPVVAEGEVPEMAAPAEGVTTAGPFGGPHGFRRPRARDALGGALTLGRSALRDLRFRCDAVVVGAGAGGSAAFARLVGGGLEAVLLDVGGAPSAGDFNQRELDMMPALYREAGLRATADESIGILQGSGVGGSTLHNTGLVVPAPPGILARWRGEHGLPWSDDALAAETERVLSALGATPVPEEHINPFNRALQQGAHALGWSAFVARHNRVECSGCGYCMVGCAYNRKTNAAFAFVAPAVAAGGRVLADARAIRVREERDGWRVRGELLDGGGRPTGRSFEARARIVILACGAIDTPVLLRLSGLGGDGVGEGLRLHPAPLLTGVFDEDIRAWRGLPQAVLVDEFASFHRDGRGGFLLLASNAGPAMTAALQQGLGEDHRRSMEAYAHAGTAAVLLHDETAGRVSTAAGGRPRVQYRLAPGDQRELRRGMYALGRLLFAAGARELRLPGQGGDSVRDDEGLRGAIGGLSLAPHRVRLDSVHPQGTCAIGEDPKRAPCDPHGRLRGAPGLYVADTSLFPTSVGVPPQVTTMVLAGLVADSALADRGG
ncbi:MAG TPA: GMC family oxidoreductase [Longimicrobiales bacterium]|nr:GMC family oxidoreductase [Longimicrobiales bacterium]